MLLILKGGNYATRSSLKILNYVLDSFSEVYMIEKMRFFLFECSKNGVEMTYFVFLGV